MAGIINPLTYKGWSVVDADKLKTGVVYAGDNSTNVPDQYCIIYTAGTGDRAQFAISRTSGKTYTRVIIPGNWNELWFSTNKCI